MPMDKKKYPGNWYQIAYFIKYQAGWICQDCGQQCRRPGEKFDTHKRTATVSHNDHKPFNCTKKNLVCRCSGCHLRYDAKHHSRTRRR